jgi:hypothetical protein
MHYIRHWVVSLQAMRMYACLSSSREYQMPHPKTSWCEPDSSGLPSGIYLTHACSWNVLLNVLFSLV